MMKTRSFVLNIMLPAKSLAWMICQPLLPLDFVGKQRPSGAGPRRRGRGAPPRGRRHVQRLQALRDRAAEGAGSVPPRARTARRGGAVRGALGRALARRGEERGPNGLRRLLVGRLADHRRRPLEPRERLAERLGSERPLAVGQVLRLVPV